VADSTFRNGGRDDGGGRTHVLITGSGGRIGRVLREGLEDTHNVIGLDVRAGAGVDVVADMTKLKRIQRYFDGVEAVIDLAAVPSVGASWQTVRENNISATLNALEAARLAGVRRVVFASSNHVTGMYERDEPYRSIIAGAYDGLDPERVPRLGADAPIRPDGPYAVGKALGEAAGRFYSDEYGLSVICLRIGHVNLDDRPKEPGQFATLLSHRDLVELVRCCLAAPPTLRFGVFYGVSANRWRFWDLDAARAAIGFEPRDDAERIR
jgi:nucleoside-diphosphate-sugar epimerase